MPRTRTRNTHFYSQGALANTQRLADVETPSAARTQYWLLIQDTLYFQGGVIEYGMESWKTDGTTEGTSIFDANPASNSALPPTTATLLGEDILLEMPTAMALNLISPTVRPQGQCALKSQPNSESSSHRYWGNDQWSLVREPIGGRELWRTDGTPEAPNKSFLKRQLLISYAKVLGEHIYWGEDEGGVQLWKTDGTLPGTQKVKKLSERR